MRYHGTVQVLSLVLVTFGFAEAFVTVDRKHGNQLSTLFAGVSTTETITELDVVLFGVGDLRTDDHLGLIEATKSTSSRVLPLVVLDEESLSNVPGVVSHTYDTAALITEAVNDLKATLAKSELYLHVTVGEQSLSEGLSKILANFPAETDIRIHVCDSGDADNALGYTPISNLKNGLPENVVIKPWSCHLWEQSWSEVSNLPKRYPEFEGQRKESPSEPVQFDGSAAKDRGVTIDNWTEVPTTNDLCKVLKRKLSLDDDRCEAERNSGLYGTHWGGLESSTVSESKIQGTIQTYVEKCQENDELYAKISVPCTRNPNSLEHASMCWNMRGEGESEAQPVANNMIAGERLTRQLLAPLLLGTVSPRRIWHSMKKGSFLFQSPIKTLVETSEWHKLLAARNLRTDAQYQGSSGSIQYKYWRWHGFLCRYVEADLTQAKTPGSEGIVLVHGFGASGAQLTKTIECLSEKLSDSTNVGKCVAPDMIGFGQSEKPPITYTGYMWESFVGDFIKDVATTRCQMDSFVIGGNSIGGFISMCAAANDACTDPAAISGSGSPGTGKCNGAILMNPAGVIQSKEDILAVEQASNGRPLLSVAQVTVLDGLPPLKPFPRPLARAFGTGLLAYLRPRIREICVKLYPTNPDAVDRDLCENILRDSLDPGAINVMISGSKLPMPRTYNEVIAANFGQASESNESQFTGPILMAQGILDPLNDAKGRSKALQKLRSGITVDPIQAGHCPHDELPDQVAHSIVKWLDATRAERMGMSLLTREEPQMAMMQMESTGMMMTRSKDSREEPQMATAQEESTHEESREELQTIMATTQNQSRREEPKYDGSLTYDI